VLFYVQGSKEIFKKVYYNVLCPNRYIQITLFLKNISKHTNMKMY